MEEMADQEELLRFLCTRRSVRKFSDRRIPDKLIRRILETATWAPSAHNQQPWRFGVINSTPLKKRLAHAMGEEFRQDLARDGFLAEQIEPRAQRSIQRIESATAAVVLCLDQADVPTQARLDLQEGEQIMAVQSVALAGGQLLLAAHAVGIAGVWLCAPLFAPQIVRQVLSLPDTWQPQALLLLGYSQNVPEPPSRKPLEEVALFL